MTSQSSTELTLLFVITLVSYVLIRHQTCIKYRRLVLIVITVRTVVESFTEQLFPNSILIRFSPDLSVSGYSKIQRNISVKCEEHGEPPAKTDIVAVTETWLKHDETKSTIADISPPGYSFSHEPRADQRAGGGVGILVSDQFKTDIHPLPSFKTFEAISARIGNNSFSGFVVCLYRLQNGTRQFLDEFQYLLENIISLHDNLYILGDFNLHLDNSNGNPNKFNEIITCFDLKQHVNFPTHVHGHWLDLLITKLISNCIKSVFSASGISDHLAVISEIDCCKTK